VAKRSFENRHLSRLHQGNGVFQSCCNDGYCARRMLAAVVTLATHITQLSHTVGGWTFFSGESSIRWTSWPLRRGHYCKSRSRGGLDSPSKKTIGWSSSKAFMIFFEGNLSEFGPMADVLDCSDWTVAEATRSAFRTDRGGTLPLRSVRRRRAAYTRDSLAFLSQRVSPSRLILLSRRAILWQTRRHRPNE
jgi:hypothetical protein